MIEKNNIRKKIFFYLFIILIIVMIPNIMVKIIKNKVNRYSYYLKENKELLDQLENKKFYTIGDLIYSINSLNSEKKVVDNLDEFEDIVYEKQVNVIIDANHMDDNSQINIKVNDEECLNNILEDTNDIQLQLLEGMNNIEISIFENNELYYYKERKIYYIKKYIKQFAEKSSNFGITVQYINGTREKYENSNKQLKELGAMNIKGEICLADYSNENKNYDWIKDLKDNSNFNIILLLNINPLKIDSQNTIYKIEDFVNKIYTNLNINKIELLNEVNFRYKTDDEINWYKNCMNYMIKRYKNLHFWPSTNANSYNDSRKITSVEFYNKYNNLDEKNIIENYNIHPYSFKSENELLEKILEHKKIINENGGFINLNVSEYGITTYLKNENEQAQILVKQSILLEQDVKYKIIYDLWSTDREGGTENYGILDNDYIPRKSFYSMQNFFENTNGAEYIGTVNIAEGLEGHIYDKDGKPIIITWSENSTNNIQIDYKDFTAKDLYGKDIQPDENGKLTITASPVYLYDVDYNYFYKAISNVATSKYDEFKEKFATEILQISGFEEKINQRQNYIQSVANTQKLMQSTAITAMKSHYELGDIILKEYEEGQLKVEPVKISSMLDMINDIGNSYEDLVTVSVNNTINSVMKTLDEANVDSSELTTTKQKIDETENLINTNTDVEIIYPTKILQFSKDCYEKADYINSLEEQNDIKAGLIISNNLHAQLLADWANKFASIQINNNINEYIAQNPVTIEYSETNITNKSVKATIKTNAEIQITNNSNSKEYVFDQNGSFTFEYTIKGQAKQITAKVTNIDKTSPIINGVIDGKLYTIKITPTITDENLDTIKLILNGEEVKNFKSVTTLTEEGFYTLTAIDKAGNKTQISFQIMKNNNQNYIIQDNIIKNISEQTKKADFDNKLKLGITYKIARNEKEISNTDSIATGDILTTSAGDKYTLIVTGDLNKDGKLNLKDLVKMRKYFLDGNNLDENEMLAANCNFDGKINLKDLVKMRLMLLNQDATK